MRKIFLAITMATAITLTGCVQEQASSTEPAKDLTLNERLIKEGMIPLPLSESDMDELAYLMCVNLAQGDSYEELVEDLKYEGIDEFYTDEETERFVGIVHTHECPF